jgi:hypothetical protein
LVAFFINASGNLFVFIYKNLSVKGDPDVKTNSTIIYSTITFIKNIQFCIAISRKNTKVTSAEKTKDDEFDDDISYPITNLN